MLLKDIGEKIFRLYHIDDDLLIYPNKEENILEFVEFTEGFTQDGEVYEDIYSILFTIYMNDDNIITCIESTSNSIINKNSVNTIKYLISLLDAKIEDVNKYINKDEISISKILNKDQK